MSMDFYFLLIQTLEKDRERMRLLACINKLELPDCWIGAGFVRNAVWDLLHQKTTPLSNFDIDVIYFDSSSCQSDRDVNLENQLKELEPNYNWSVKNQARMHLRNNDEAYLNSEDALSKWPETATCIAAQIQKNGQLKIIAPHGLEDIFNLKISPTHHYRKKLPIFRNRIAQKNWSKTWPQLKISNFATHSK